MGEKPKKPKGGARKGAGRPKGSSTAMKVALLLQTAANGPTPLEFLCAVYRNDEIPLPFRLHAAVHAARYVHTPLSPQRAVADEDRHLTIEVIEFSEADFEREEDYRGQPVEDERRVRNGGTEWPAHIRPPRRSG